MLRRATVNNVLYSRTVSYPDKEDSPRFGSVSPKKPTVMGFLRKYGSTVRRRKRSSCVGTSNGIALALSNMQSNIFATSNKHGMQQQKYRPPRSRNLSLWARAGRDDGRRSPASAASRGRAPPSPYHSNLRSRIFLIEFACGAR